ncbi:MAG: DUF4838 domain-containing protein, partial [Clostridia bacterium]|nr:DUF4838 domain-containing protein [Clostridia bacterium]
EGTEMKRIISIFLAVIIIIPTFIIGVSASDGVVIDSDYSIVVQNEKDVYQSAAARELQKYLAQAGLDIPIVKDAEKSITICTSGNKSIYTDGYRIYTSGESVFIDARPVRGLIHGVYRFLEEFAGLRIYTSKLKLIDETDSIFVPDSTNIYYKPYFEYTETDFVSPKDTEYSLANGLTGGVYRTIPAELGGTVNYLGSFAHTLTTQFCSADKYFETHPEYFALRDGKRTSKQLCLSNPETLSVVTEEVLETVRLKHDPDASLQIVSITQNDNYDYCQCDKCAAFDASHGGTPSASILNFVNQIADAVKQAGYNNVAVDTFAYQYSRRAPAGIVPRDNVIIRLCTIEGCFMHPFDDPDCPENVGIMNDLNEWSKICERIYIWDYVNNYKNTLGVWPDFGVIQKNIQIFYEHNVKGIYEEGNYYMYMADDEFGELKSYMISRCLQDPYCDLEKDVDGFLAAYYGDGWQNIKDFIALSVEKGGRKDTHMSIYENAQDCLRFKRKDIKSADKMWADALEEAKEDYQTENIKRSMLSYRYYKACALKGEFSVFNPMRFEETEKLYNDMISSGIACDAEMRFNGEMLDDPFARYLAPNKWGRVSENSFYGIVIRIYIFILEYIELETGIHPVLWA